MDHAILLKTVENSTATDWHKMEVQTVVKWVFGQRDEQWCAEPHVHSSLAVYKPDVDISLVFASALSDEFAEEWAKKFPDPHSSMVEVWLRYRGQVVWTSNYVIVDGGRYLLPLPKPADKGIYRVPNAKMPMAELLFKLYGSGGAHDSAADALNRAQVVIE